MIDSILETMNTFSITIVVNAPNYYAFGGVLRSYATGGLSGERYKFTGKERDTERQAYDYFSGGDGFARCPLLRQQPWKMVNTRPAGR